MDENPNLLKMYFFKKLKVSWQNGMLMLAIFCLTTVSAWGQCGVSVPSKLVYIGIYTENNVVPASQVVQIPVVNQKDSLRFISWEMPDELITLDVAKNLPQFDLSKFDNSGIKKFELVGSCGIFDYQKVKIEMTFLPAVHPRNAVTGNSDGINDTWEIINLDKYKGSPLPVVKVFDRWGNMVFESKDGYRNNKFVGYDNSINKFLNTGTYVYSVIPHPDYPEIIGELTLVR